VKEMEEARDIVSHQLITSISGFISCHFLFQLEQMGLEIRELPPPMKSKYQTRIQSFTAELTRLENEFKKTRDSYERKREELLGEGSEENLYSQKQRLIDNSEKLERGSKRLDVGYRVAIETEQIGNEILTDLNEQRETIQRTRNRVHIIILYILHFTLIHHSYYLVERDGRRAGQKRTLAKPNGDEGDAKSTRHSRLTLTDPLRNHRRRLLHCPQEALVPVPSYLSCQP